MRAVSTGIVSLLALAALLQGTVFILAALRVEVPAPRLVLELVQRQMREEGVQVQWEAISLDLTARVHARNLRLIDSHSGELLFSAEAALAALDVSSLLARKLEVESVRVDDATLFAPSMVASGGVAAPVVSEVHLSLRARKDVFEVIQGQGLVTGVPVYASGPFGRFDVAEETRPPLADRLIQVAGTFFQLQRLAQEFTDPYILIQGEGLYVGLRVLADAATTPFAEVQDLDLVGDARLSNGAPQLQRLQAHVNAMAMTSGDSVGRAAVLIVPDKALDLRRPDVGALGGMAEFWIAGATARQQPLSGIAGRIARRGDALSGGVVGRMDGELLSVQAAVGEKLSLTMNGALQLPTVLKLVGAPEELILRWFRAHQPIRISAQLQAGPGFTSPTLSFIGETRDVDARGMLVDYAGARGWADLNQVVLERVDAVRGVSQARGSFRQDLRSLQWRLLIEGRAYPDQLSPLLGNWWRAIWTDFVFDGPPLVTDVDVGGNWRSPDYADVFGVATAKGGVYNGVRIDNARMRFHGGRGYFALVDLVAGRDGHTLRGDIGWVYTLNPAQLQRMSFDLEGDLPLDDLNQAFNVKLDDVLEEWTFRDPPRLDLRGNVVHVGENSWSTQLFAHGLAGAGAWRTIPFQNIELTVRHVDNSTFIDIPEITPVGGQGAGRVEILQGTEGERVLELDFELQDGDLAQAVTALRGLGDHQSADNREGDGTDQFEGKVNFDLAGTADPEAFAETLLGKGNVEVFDAKLGQIELFGTLSQQLNAVGIRFSSFPLENVTGAFDVREGQVAFDDLKVFGPTVNIEADGSLGLLSGLLDFDVRVFLLEGATPSLMDVFGLILKPFGYALELQLKGALSSPTWRFTMDPRNLFAPREQAPAGEAPPPDGTTREPIGSEAPAPPSK